MASGSNLFLLSPPQEALCFWPMLHLNSKGGTMLTLTPYSKSQGGTQRPSETHSVNDVSPQLAVPSGASALLWRLDSSSASQNQQQWWLHVGSASADRDRDRRGPSVSSTAPATKQPPQPESSALPHQPAGLAAPEPRCLLHRRRSVTTNHVGTSSTSVFKDRIWNITSRNAEMPRWATAPISKSHSPMTPPFVKKE